MVTLQPATRTSVLQQPTQQPQPQKEQRIRIIRNNEWTYVLPSELTDDERRAIFVAAFNIYE